MILWMILTLMTAAVAVYVAAPFLRRLDAAAAAKAGASELGIYRDQLAEVDREQTSGLIQTGEAEQARAEIKRRLLAADKTAAGAGAGTPLTALEHKFVFLTTTGLVVLGSVILYALMGSPQVPSGVPGAAPPSAPAPVASEGAAAPADGKQADVESMIGKLVARLQANPNDAEGWRMLGWSYLRTERNAQAVEAYRKAVALEPKSAVSQSSLGEALVRTAEGKVTPEASAAFDAALALDAKDPSARFFKGLAKQQAGDAKAAVEDWIALLKDSAPDADYVADLRQRITETAQQIGLDVSSRLPASPATAAAPASPGPTSGDAAAIESMTPEQQKAMIASMVDRLDKRLEASPRDVEGWIKLMQARKVLDDPTAAKAALGRALAAFADSSADQERIKAAAAKLGLQP